MEPDICEVPGLKQAPEILIFIDEDKVLSTLAKGLIADTLNIINTCNTINTLNTISTINTLNTFRIMSTKEFILWPHICELGRHDESICISNMMCGTQM